MPLMKQGLNDSSSQTRLNNAKTTVLEEERKDQIEKRNQQLYLKMKEIEMSQM